MVPTLTCAAALLALVLYTPPGHAQLAGEQGALTRLQHQADDAMAHGDAQGAAIHIGRAALLASQRIRQGLPEPEQPRYRLMVDLFRAREQVYRALALFEQSGERLPVSSGICRLLILGRQHAGQAQKTGATITTGTAGQTLDEPLQHQTREWLDIIQELQLNWECNHPG